MDLFLKQTDIERWANSNDAKWSLPHVLRRLIWSTTHEISKIEFPAYEAGNRPGFDGEVVCADPSHPWVPEGRSVWELGAGKSVKAKVSGDFVKRSNLETTPREMQEQSAYVFVTPRRFDKKKEWENANKSVGHWRSIRALDVIDLEHWIETAPAGIRAWLGRLVGKRPAGVDDVEGRWDAIANQFPTPLLPSVFLAGRQQSVHRLNEWLCDKPARLGFECRSPTELVDFFCATVATMDEPTRLDIESRAVIVPDQDAWVSLRDITPNAILVVDPSLDLSREDIARAVHNGHHVLVATDPSLHGQRTSELEPVPQFELAQSLEESGYSPAIAGKLSRAAGGSLAVLKNKLSPPDTRSFPAWASNISSDVITACLLLGGWDKNEADERAFSQIAGRSYSECEVELQLMADSRDPLLLHAAGKWRLISKDYAWALFEARVSGAALERFESLCLAILADDDPRFLLPENDRFMANIRGHVPRYSGTIKANVSETLAFLGAFGEKLQAASSTNIVATVDRIVSELLCDSVTWHRWASLDSQLPLIAEASPDRFVAAIERDLKKADSAVIQLLHEEEEAFFGRCNHAGLLWALEGLAWTPRWMPKVAAILLDLSAADSKTSRWGNRPKNSLSEILSYWIPHTTANVDERIQTLNLLSRRDEITTFGLLLSLLPTPDGSCSTPTHKPYWRDWADSWERGATRGDTYKFILATAERLLELSGNIPSRWKHLVEAIGQLPHAVLDGFLSLASAFAESDISDVDRRLVADALSEQINRHRHFQDSDWAIPADVLAKLNCILENLKPKDCRLRHAWLFEQWPDRFFERSGTYEEQQSALDVERGTALDEILSSNGFAGVLSLVSIVASPGDVGRTLAINSEDQFLGDIIPCCLQSDPKELSFAQGFIWNRFWNRRWEWIDAVMPYCADPDAKAKLLEAVEFSPDAWSRAETAGAEVATAYWNRVRAFNPQLHSDSVKFSVEKLLKCRRALSAVDLLAMAIHKKIDVDQDTQFRVLEALLALNADESGRDRHQADQHHIQTLIQALQQRPDVDQNRLASIEFHYIRLLDGRHGHSPVTLRKQLSASPEFFNEVLSACSLPRNREKSNDPELPDPRFKYMAEHGYRLLHDWDVVPGTEDDGSISEDTLRSWCHEARRIAEANGRLEVCDHNLGQVLVKSEHSDVNGAWPCAAIRHVAEEIQTDSLGSGLSCGIHNSRGPTWRASGGDQERELESKFRSKADLIRFDSPFVAGILDRVADSYHKEAAWWDERERWEA